VVGGLLISSFLFTGLFAVSSIAVIGSFARDRSYNYDFRSLASRFMYKNIGFAVPALVLVKHKPEFGLVLLIGAGADLLALLLLPDSTAGWIPTKLSLIALAASGMGILFVAALWSAL
jgi:hypothetical protein